MDWESVRSKYERIREIFIEKDSVEGKEFPVLDNPELISKDRVAAKFKKKYDKIMRKLQMSKGKVVEVVSCLCCLISAKLFGEDLLQLQVCKRELILVAKLIKRMWIVY